MVTYNGTTLSVESSTGDKVKLLVNGRTVMLTMYELFDLRHALTRMDVDEVVTRDTIKGHVFSWLDNDNDWIKAPTKKTSEKPLASEGK